MADLPALAEIVENGRTGRLYPAGNVQSLADTIYELLQNESDREIIGENAKNWILHNRTWNNAVLSNSNL